ncbi:uncharacterized protein cubi_01505 [Cryptosporidium ubiquitum]|uniref:Uncharacterized protein n=1 Tax=Cryptosporidium ubiquitum TaxID=857276 RepID=A0A1J4MGM5_9CRYT|nr:uncharacterized protein cubi_01505 [Cryptosporidium ubiquitum]OII72172.1 hypothetical protein cubi_01505 [Cryptosporidium ubiquitum]
MKPIELVCLICTFLYLNFQVTLANDTQASLIEQEKLYKIGIEENEYDKVADENWVNFTPEKRCQLIIDKLENDVKRSASNAKENLIVYTILRPVPVDDSGACFKRIILWHFEKVELVKSNKSILNYEDIIPVRLLLLGMSPNQIEKEPRDLAEIPEFLEIACKQLLSQKPRMRWPLSGARYHPYISNILGFQKVWIYRVSELLSACAQHTYQSSNGYMIMLLVSTEQMVDDSIFGDYQNAWKGRYGQKNKEEIILDMDNKGKNTVKPTPAVIGGENTQGRKVIDFDIPEDAEKINTNANSPDSSQNVVDIEVIKPPNRNRVVYSPEKLPVYEIPNSVTSEICIEVGTKEIPGLSKYKQFPISNFNTDGFSSIIVPPNRILETPEYTVIQPDDRASINLLEYRNFWKRPNYVNKYRDVDSLHDYLIERTNLYWPETSNNYLEFENEKFVRPLIQNRIENDEIEPDSQLMINPRLGGYLENQYIGGEEPLIQPFQSSELADSYDYGSPENDPQIQRLAYFDNNELSEDERSTIDESPDKFFSFPVQRKGGNLNIYKDPLLKVNFQGMTGRRVNKQPFLNFEADESFQDKDSSQDDDNSVSYSKFRDAARTAIVKWYIGDDNEGDNHLTGKDRRAIKKLFSYIEEINPDNYNELMSRGEDYMVRQIIRIGKSKDDNFQNILATRKNRSGIDDNYYGIYREKHIPKGILKSKNKGKRVKNRRRNRGRDNKSSKRNRKNGKRRRRGSSRNKEESTSISETESESSEVIANIPKDIFIQDILNEKYDFQNILKKERLKRFQKILKDALAARVNKIEKKGKTLVPTKNVEILKYSVINEQKNRDQLENEYKKNLEEHAKILDLLKKNQEKLRQKMEEEHKKKQEELRRDMRDSVNQLEAALDTASGAIQEIEKEKKFLDERLKGLETDNKHIRTLINMKDNYIKKMEKNRIELETKQEIEMKEMRESYERQLSELKKNLSKDDTISGLSNMVSNLEYEAKKNLEKIEENTLSDEKIKQAIEQRLKDREKQLELAYQKQKQRDTDYLNYVLQILESKESEEAKKVIKELKERILELEEKQEELQHTREELEMINNDLIQTVEEQNKSLRELMKKVEDLKIQKEKAQDELNIAREKYNDITQVEKRLKDQLEEIKRSGAPSDEIIKHLQKSLDVAEKERMLASEIVKNAELNYGNCENNVKIAMEKLDKIKAKAGTQKEFEKELKAEIEKRLNSNKNALVMFGQGEAEQEDYLLSSEIKPLNKKELEELNRLRNLGLDELSDDEKKKLLILGQRQLATMELSVVSTFGELNNQISKVMDNEEIEKSKVLWNQVSDSSVNRMDVENSLGEILLEKIEGQEQSLNNMKNLLEETQNTISELNKQLILQRELSGEANQHGKDNKGKGDASTGISSDFHIYDNSNNINEAREEKSDRYKHQDDNEESSNKVFEEVSNDIIIPGAEKTEDIGKEMKTKNLKGYSSEISSPPLPGQGLDASDYKEKVDFYAQEEEDENEVGDEDLSALKFKKELENKIKEMSEKSNSSNKESTVEQSSEESVQEKILDQEKNKIKEEEEQPNQDFSRKRSDSLSSNLGRKERLNTPISVQKITSDFPEVDLKNTLVGNTEYEKNVNQHNHPLEKTENGFSESLYMLHDVQNERPPSSGITCDNIINTIKRNLDIFSRSFDSGKLQSQNEVMTRTVLPGMQYDECYNSTMITFENFQEKMTENGVFIRVFVLLTDFMDTLMIGDTSRTGYIMSNIPPVIYRVLGNTISSGSNEKTQNGQTPETIETVINNFPSEWIHEHMRTCKEVLSGKSLDAITKSRSISSPNIFSPMRSSSSLNMSHNYEGLKNLPPIFLANIEVSPRPDKEPCIRIIKRIKQRISEVNGLLIRKRELQEKLKIKDAQEKLFIFTFEDTLPYNLSSPGTSQYCEKYLSELFIKMNNMEWRAKPRNNSLVRLITIPTSSDPLKTSIQDENQINLNEWKKEALRLAFDSSITNEWMGNSLVEYLTNKRITKNSGFLSNELAKTLIIKLLDTISLKDDSSKEILMQHGWGIGGTGPGTVNGGSASGSDEGVLNRIFNNIQDTISAKANGNTVNDKRFKTIPGVILILRTSDQIPPNTIINPLLLSLKPDESPYMIETIKSKNAEE